jgi:ABC-type xylose transport system permease subunit
MNGMTILNITEYWQMVVRGGVFLFAVCADGIQKQFIRREKTVALA